MISHNAHWITREDRAAVDGVLRSGWIAQGPEVEAFEAEFAAKVGTEAACAVSSGSAAMWLALRCYGVSDGQIVGLPSYACTVLAQVVKLTGSYPQLWDCDSWGHAVPKWFRNQKPQAALVVSTYGIPCSHLTRTLEGVKVVECNAPSLGYGTVSAPLACYSFGPSKMITTCGAGGMIAGRRDLIEWCRDMRDYDGKRIFRERFNLQMTDVAAAMGRSQLSRLDEIVRRRQNACHAYEYIIDEGFQAKYGDNGYRLVVHFETEAERNSCKASLAESGVETRVPIETWELIHRQIGRDDAHFPMSERLARTALSLPTHPGLSAKDLATIRKAWDKWRATC